MEQSATFDIEATLKRMAERKAAGHELRPEQRAVLDKRLEMFIGECVEDAARLREAAAEHAAEHAALKVQIDATHLIDRLAELRGTPLTYEIENQLREAFESALAALPTEPLDQATLAQLARRHVARRLVEKTVELRGPVSAAAEHALGQKLEEAIAAADAAQAQSITERKRSSQ
jgi:hypothetical protein